MSEEKISKGKLEKASKIQEIKEILASCKGLVMVDYKGINVADDTALRAKCREADVAYKVYKNRLVLKAMQEMNISGFDKDLEGPTAFAFAMNDALAAAKVIAETAKTVKALEVKCGMMDNAYVGADVVAKLATIPSKEVLLAQLLGLLQSPISGFARAISQVAEKCA